MLFPRVADAARDSACVVLVPVRAWPEPAVYVGTSTEDTPMQRRSILLSSLPLIAGLVLVAGMASSPTEAEAAKRQCGFVTANEGVVPESQGIFMAFITQIDGKSTKTGNRQRVDAGTHTLTISEQIPAQYLAASEIVEIKRMKRHEDAKAYKKFEVTVEADTTLRIGVRLLRDKLDNDSIAANAYWEPVVWETVPSKCG